MSRLAEVGGAQVACRVQMLVEGHSEFSYRPYDLASRLRVYGDGLRIAGENVERALPTSSLQFTGDCFHQDGADPLSSSVAMHRQVTDDRNAMLF